MDTLFSSSIRLKLFCAIIGYLCSTCCYGDTVAGNAVSSTDYLVKFGYLRPQDPKTGALRSKEEFNRAIATFQRFAGLPITGQINDETVTMMNTPRCGVSDMVGTSNAARRRKRYALQGSQWGKHELTYKVIRYTTDLTRAQVDDEIRKAFEVWSKHTPITFRQISNGRADINVAFVYGEHGDGNAFDGPKGTLAHAYFPLYGGDAHFDESELWTINSQTGTNLLQVASHEFGHSLGLAHSDVSASLMAPFYRGYTDQIELHEDDIQAVQELYGKPVPPTTTENPPTQPPIQIQPTDPPVVESPRQPPTSPKPQYRPPAAGAPDICKEPSVDTVTRTYDGSTYVFKGAYYYKLVRFGYDPEYPRLIKDDWEGLPDDLDAAFYLKSRGTTYFFKDDKYWKFVNRRLMPNYPRLISNGYPGMPTHIDAAFQWSGNGKIYFVKDGQYWRYGRSKVDYGYPRYLNKWRGLPDKIDAAFQYSNKRTYFFSGNQYYKFNDRQFMVDAKYPRDTAEWWFGCSPVLEKLRDHHENEESENDSPWIVVGVDKESSARKDGPVGSASRISSTLVFLLLPLFYLFRS